MDEDGLALWEILDDIDTIGDMARSDDAGYRKLVSKRVKLRFDIYNPEWQEAGNE
ncbi:MAG: hypothetical protein M0Q91_10140 [Methanoregula sp.]|nr:hypothetical protein [Methanoregula sp.]